MEAELRLWWTCLRPSFYMAFMGAIPLDEVDHTCIIKYNLLGVLPSLDEHYLCSAGQA